MTEDSKSGDLRIEDEVSTLAELVPNDTEVYRKLLTFRTRRESERTSNLERSSESTAFNASVPTVKLAQREREAAEARRHTRIRDDAEFVKDQLYALFLKKNAYTLKELEKLTNQPTAHLKKILQEIAYVPRGGKHWMLTGTSKADT